LKSPAEETLSPVNEKGSPPIDHETVDRAGRGEIHVGYAGGAAEEDDGGAIIGGARGADDDVVEAVAVEVAGRRDADAGDETGAGPPMVAPELGLMSVPRSKSNGKGRPAALPKMTIGFARIGAAIVAADAPIIRSSKPSPLTSPPRRRFGPASRRGIALDDEPVGGASAARSMSRIRRLAENDIGFARIGAAIVAIACADDDVVEAVAVDVAGRGDTPARLVAGGIALDDEAVGRSEGGEVDGRKAAALPKMT
jgi:hypothetical protein